MDAESSIRAVSAKPLAAIGSMPS